MQAASAPELAQDEREEGRGKRDRGEPPAEAALRLLLRGLLLRLLHDRRQLRVFILLSTRLAACSEVLGLYIARRDLKRDPAHAGQIIFRPCMGVRLVQLKRLLAGQGVLPGEVVALGIARRDAAIAQHQHGGRRIVHAVAARGDGLHILEKVLRPVLRRDALVIDEVLRERLSDGLQDLRVFPCIPLPSGACAAPAATGVSSRNCASANAR